MDPVPDTLVKRRKNDGEHDQKKSEPRRPDTQTPRPVETHGRRPGLGCLGAVVRGPGRFGHRGASQEVLHPVVDGRRPQSAAHVRPQAGGRVRCETHLGAGHQHRRAPASTGCPDGGPGAGAVDDDRDQRSLRRQVLPAHRLQADLGIRAPIDRLHRVLAGQPPRRPDAGLCHDRCRLRPQRRRSPVPQRPGLPRTRSRSAVGQ